MYLLIDAGNTNIKFTLFDGGTFNSIHFDALKNLEPLPEFAVLSSVAKQTAVQPILDWLRAKQITFHIVKVETTAFGVQCAYSNTQNLGVDRWLAILGANAEWPNQNLVVVDAGTAMTVDVITPTQSGAAHLGGWIIPGLSLMQDSICQLAPGVFSDSNIKPEHLGTDTPSALYHGCLHALVGAVHQALSLLENQTEVIVVITGGDSEVLAAMLQQQSVPVVQDKNIVFKGLSLFLPKEG